MYRKCPKCGANVGPITLFKPGVVKNATPDSAVVCKKCGSIISPSWRNFYWLGFFGYGLSGLMFKLIPKESFGVQSEFLYLLIILFLAMLVTFIPLYIWFPLRRMESDSK